MSYVIERFLNKHEMANKEIVLNVIKTLQKEKVILNEKFKGNNILFNMKNNSFTIESKSKNYRFDFTNEFEQSQVEALSKIIKVNKKTITLPNNNKVTADLLILIVKTINNN